MESIHGVDVSWLHHSTKGQSIRTDVSSGLKAVQRPEASAEVSHHYANKSADHRHPRIHPSSSPASSHDALIPTSNGQSDPPVAPVTSQQAPPSSPAPTLTTTPKSNSKRPAFLSRSSADKAHSLVAPPADSSKSTQRRNSWISSLSAKFSSAPAHHNNPTSTNTTSPQQQHQTNGVQASSVNGGIHSHDNARAPTDASHKGTSSGLEPYVPQPPKQASSSFFSSALRRLSTSSQGSLSGKMVCNGGVCPRKVLNVDPNRERCVFPELNASKLRRVAFSVDVEIAGGPIYHDEEDQAEKRKKFNDKKIKERAEGEAFKHPDTAALKKDEAASEDGRADEAIVGDDSATEARKVEGAGKTASLSSKKEKKKRTEEEKQERKEKKRRKAEENGSLPLHITANGDESAQESVTGMSTPVPAPAPKPNERPTTDPVRIYRRCCQLRETPILKRITEQLSAPDVCPIATPGVVSILDLTGSRLQLADFATLGDWLAVVPVRKLLLEDANMTDEAVRVVLAGLLAAKTPEQAQSRRRSSNGKAKRFDEWTGVIEKLTFKNNPRITRDGWKYIALFLYMCKSIKAMDLSMIAFPQPPAPTDSSTTPDTSSERPASVDMAELISKALAERRAGSQLEELIMAECNLTARDVRHIVDGVTISGLRRLSLAGNNVGIESLDYINRYLRSGVCEGLDLGGNDMRDKIGKLSEALTDKCDIWALSLANCNLNPESLVPLFPALVSLPQFRFIDLSHNRDLFHAEPSALGLLRKYIPQLALLKRIHLNDVSMTAAHAIRLAEVLPESPHLAHLNILDNPQLSALASATDEASQEEAAALYASLMAAVRVSESIICVDIDVPSPGSSEVVKALAKQVVAYCLRNMERFTAAEAAKSGDAALYADDSQGSEKEVAVPDVLVHLVGPSDTTQHAENEDEIAPDDDYIVGGTGVVKALSYCLLDKSADALQRSMPTSGTASPKGTIHDAEIGKAKAKDMSKHLLNSARKIRTRLQPALCREARAGDEMAYKRLSFLDQTLRGMIQRFEDEYPETRLPPPTVTETASSISGTGSRASSPVSSLVSADQGLSDAGTTATDIGLLDDDDDEDEESDTRRLRRARHASDVSLASRALALEEGRVHRIGMKVKRDILARESDDPTPGTVDEALHDKIDALSGEEIRDRVVSGQWEATVREMGAKVEDMRRAERTASQSPDPVQADKA